MRSGRINIALKEGPTPLAGSLMDHPVVGFYAHTPKPYNSDSHAQSPFVAWALLVSAIFTKVVILDEEGCLPCPQTLELDAVPCMISDMAQAWNWHRRDAKRFLLELAECGLVSDELAVAVIAKLSTSRMSKPRLPMRKATRAAIMAKTSGRCIYCGTPLTTQPNKPNSLHVDHMLAVANGATDDPAVLAPACARCNLKKGSKTLVEFISGRH